MQLIKKNPGQIKYQHFLQKQVLGFLLLSLFYFFVWDRSLQTHACKAGALPLKPQLQSISLWLFWRWGLTSCLG
jgi:hypothetical protein